MIKYKVVLTDADIRMIFHALDILEQEYSYIDDNDTEAKKSEAYIKEINILKNKINLNIMN